MVNVFGQLPQQTPPQQGGQLDDVKDVITKLLEQQQANEPVPRPPTPQEEQQIKQTAMTMLQQKGLTPNLQQEAVAQNGQPNQPVPQAPAETAKPMMASPMPDQASSALDDLLSSASQPPGPQEQPPEQPWNPQDAMKRLVTNDPNYPWKDNTFSVPTAPKQAGISDADKAAAYKKLKEIQGGIVDYYDSRMPLIGPERWERSAAAGPNAVRLEDVKKRDPVDFFRTEGPKIMSQSYMKGIPVLDQKYKEAQDLIAKLQPSAPGALTPEQTKAQEKINALPGAYTPEEKQTLLGTDKTTPQPAAPEEAAQQQQPRMVQGSDEHNAHIAENVAPQARETADKIIQAGGDTPDKADVIMKSQLGDDPEIDKAIAEARQTYEQIRNLNNQPPTVAQYIGAVLVALAGGSPQVIQAILHPAQHLNAEREHLAGENLMKLNLAKAANRTRLLDIRAKQGDDSIAQRRLDMQQQHFDQAEKFRMALEHQKEQRELWNKQFSDASQRASKYRELANQAVGSRKAQLEADAKDAENLADFYRQMMGGPSRQQMESSGLPKKPTPVMPKPQSMAPQGGQVSPSVMRLLGIGNA